MDYHEHEKHRFSYMTIRQLYTRLNKITNKEKLYWFGRVAEQKSREATRAYEKQEYEALAREAIRIYNKGYRENDEQITTFLDPKLFEWDE